MTGCLDTVKERCLAAEQEIKKEYPTAEVLLPYDAMKVGTPQQDHTKTLGYWMGKDIEILMNCDAIYMCEGWQKSKGCRLELVCALTYGMIMLFQRWTQN